jgi:hypothetical protein
MTETPTRRGRPRGVESQHVMVRMPVDLIAQIDAYAASLQERIGISDMAISRGMAIRELVKRGLQTVQAGPPSPQEPRPAAQPSQAPPAPMAPSHLATVDEPEPMAAPAPPMAILQAPEPEHLASMADVERANETPTHRSQRGLPREKLEEIADEWTRCQGLSLREFAQRLHDRGIYSSRAKDGSNVPANPGNLDKWLERARNEGML